MLRPFRSRRDERKVDIRGRRGRQLLLRLLGRLFQPLQCHFVAGKVHTFLGLEVRQHVIRQLLVEVVTAEPVVSGSGKHLDDAVANLDDGHVERAAAEIVNHDFLLFFIVQTVRQRRRRRLVDDTLHVQTGNLARVLGRLTLRVVEICRNRDDGLRHFLAQVTFRIGFQLLQNHRGNLLRGIPLVVNRHLEIASHLPLDGRNGLVGVGHRLTLRRLADQTLARLRERHDRRRGPRAFRVGDNGRLPAFHYGHATICRTQVNTYNLSHDNVLLFSPAFSFVSRSCHF